MRICSLCNEGGDRALIAIPTGFICDECVLLATHINAIKSEKFRDELKSILIDTEKEK